VTDSTKKCIKKINEVSRQLLSRILATHKETQTYPQELNKDNIEKRSSKKESNDIAKTMENRQTLITRLFEQNTLENISSESELVEEMIILDNKLVANAKLCKQAITEQVVKIKKSKKVTKSYQKY
jgi:hypothetical protein